MNQSVREVVGGLADTAATPASPPHAAAPPEHKTSPDGLLDLYNSPPLGAVNEHKATMTHLLSLTPLQNKLTAQISEPRLLQNIHSKLPLENCNKSSTLAKSNTVPELLNLSSSRNQINKISDVDIGAGLTTIDTSSLTSIDSSHLRSITVSTYVPVSTVQQADTTSKASRVVTAQGTIIPPLATNVQESASASRHSLEDTSSPSSPAVARQLTRTNSSSNSRPSSQLSQHSSSPYSITPAPTDLSSQQILATYSKSFSPNNDFTTNDETKSPSPTSSHQNHHPSNQSPVLNHDTKSPFCQGEIRLPFNICDVQNSSGITDVKCSPSNHDGKISITSDIKVPTITHFKSFIGNNNSNCDNTTSRYSLPPSRTPNCSSSSCPQSPSISPIPHSPCSPHSPLVSGAGCEVRGMPANPVSLRIGSASSRHSTTPASMAVDSCDGGRLTFFKEGKLVLELSHRNSGVGGGGGSASEGEGGSCWVQVKSKTYWPPPSCHTSHTQPLFTAPTSERSSLRRKQCTPHYYTAGPTICLLHLAPMLRRVRSRAMRGPGKINRNPFCRLQVDPRNILLSGVQNKEVDQLHSFKNDSRFSKCKQEKISKKYNVEKQTLLISERRGLRIDTNIKLGQLFDRFLISSPLPNNFVSPRKRYLKQMEADSEVQHKRKSVGNFNNRINTSHANGGASKAAGVHVSKHLYHAKATSNIPSSLPGSPAHSIDSILNNETKHNESYLKSLLKPDPNSNTSHHHLHSHRDHKKEVVKQENSADITYNKRDRDHNRSWNLTERKEIEERRDRDHYYDHHSHSHHPSYRHASPPCHNAPHHPPHQAAAVAPPLPTVTSAPIKDSHSETTVAGYPPGYNTLASHNLASLYPHMYDPNYLLLNGLNPLAAGGLMPTPHSQMAVAAAAAAAAAASISSINSYGLGPILAATQYSNLFNSALNPAFSPAAIAAAAAAPSLNPNLANSLQSSLTPALTPGTVTMPLPTLNPATLPPCTLTPGMSPGLPPPTTHTSYSHATSNHNHTNAAINNCSTNNSFSYSSSSSRMSPYPSPCPRSPFQSHPKSPYPHSRSPYSPHPKSPYPHSKSPHPVIKSSFPPSQPYPAYTSKPVTYNHHPQLQQQQQYHHPSRPLHSSPWKPAPTHQHSVHKQTENCSPEDLPLNLSKPRSK